jgi:2'-5' RNA ligase
MLNHKRLFFALSPDTTVRKQILGLQQHVPDNARQVVADNLHLTLLFLGSVDATEVPRLQELATGIQAGSFTLRFDHIGTWLRPHVLWAGCHQVPDELTELVNGLRRGAVACGLEVESRPYVPHLTLARKVRKKVSLELDTPVEWDVNEFCLLESITDPKGAIYTLAGKWPLTNA